MAENKSGIKTKLVRDLAELLVELDLNEIDVKDANTRIRLTRGIGGQFITAPAVAPAPANIQSTPDIRIEESATTGREVPSPMVGTIYMAPSPGAANYVSVGSRVQKGDTILIIEAMKTMNHIPAPESGTITAILVEDKQPVEYGETLVTIE